MNIKNYIRALFDSDWRFCRLAARGFYNWLPDDLYLKRLFKAKMGYELNLENPQTFNEKLQWLKLYNRKTEYTAMADKYEAKKIIAEKIGEKHIIPTLGVWNKFDDIDFDSLPNQFVLKCTHMGVIICKDKSSFDRRKAKKQINCWMKKNNYWAGREWVYKDIIPRILAETYMTDESGFELKDYKVFCFNGVPKVIQVDFDRFEEHKRNIYDTNWKLLPLEIEYSSKAERQIERPECLQELLHLASELSKGIPHIRTDFYVVQEKIYFGELTFYHGNGYEKFAPKEWCDTFGKWLELPDRGARMYR
ncbi:ATP-grasp fold amidoligase family protein [Treponema socranskii]|uniref:ATP-grasp fold amidoligase family protein n=1 Tax=Treponema socranskii TaxID=53419 RepID=UPI003D929E12